jgi:hypothetical protein
MTKLTKAQAERLLKYKRATSTMRLDRLNDTYTITEAQKLKEAAQNPGEETTQTPVPDLLGKSWIRNPGKQLTEVVNFCRGKLTGK